MFRKMLPQHSHPNAFINYGENLVRTGFDIMKYMITGVIALVLFMILRFVDGDALEDRLTPAAQFILYILVLIGILIFSVIPIKMIQNGSHHIDVGNKSSDNTLSSNAQQVAEKDAASRRPLA